MAGGQLEAVIDGDPWALHGARRGGRVTADAMVTDGKLTLSLQGNMPAATYLAGMLVEPLTRNVGEAAQLVRDYREATFRQRWIEPSADTGMTGNDELGVFDKYGVALTELDLVIAPDGAEVAEIQVVAPDGSGPIDVNISETEDWHISLGKKLWYGYWEYRRESASGNLLLAKPRGLFQSKGLYLLRVHSTAALCCA